MKRDSLSAEEIAAMQIKIKDMEALTSMIKTFPEVPNRNEFERKRILITGGAGTRQSPPMLRSTLICTLFKDDLQSFSYLCMSMLI